MRGLLGAVQFLTRVPVPAGEYELRDAVVWLPTVGLLLGTVLALVDLALRAWSAPALLASTIAVVLLVALTGALHLDGLIDTADAVLPHATLERRLEILRDPRAGAFGVVGAVCLILLKVAAVDGIGGDLRAPLLVLAPGLGRWSIVLVAAVYPYGRPDGLGAPVKQAATRGRLALASVLPAIACVAVGPVGILAAGIGALVGLGLGRSLARVLHGLTGDCYGAVCEIVETAVWIGAALASARAVT